jgi:two-component system LytT family response regulator
MLIKTIIVDDEKLARDRLLRLLKQTPDVDVIGQAAGGREAIEQINKKKPDLVILDIQMPEINGFDVIRALEDPPHIIFATAYDEYALKAFEVNAIDYLLKPFTPERLLDAITRVKARMAQKPDLKKQFDALLKLIAQGKKEYLSRIPVTKLNEILILDIDAVVWFGLEYGLVYVHSDRGKFAVKYNLNELEDLLDPEVFFRANRSEVINLSKVQKILRWFGGRIKAVMSDGAQIEVSRQQSKKLREKLKL